jgi:hypothetical protein
MGKILSSTLYEAPMGRPKKAAPKHVEPEEESQEIPEEEPEVEEEADDEPELIGKSISKAEAVRQVLAAGNDSPEDGVGYLKSIHGIEMTRQMFSSYKAQQKARDAKKRPAAPKTKPGRKMSPVAEVVQVARQIKAAAANSQPDLLDSLETLKPLIAQ